MRAGPRSALEADRLPFISSFRPLILFVRRDTRPGQRFHPEGCCIIREAHSAHERQPQRGAEHPRTRRVCTTLGQGTGPRRCFVLAFFADGPSTRAHLRAALRVSSPPVPRSVLGFLTAGGSPRVPGQGPRWLTCHSEGRTWSSATGWCWSAPCACWKSTGYKGGSRRRRRQQRQAQSDDACFFPAAGAICYDESCWPLLDGGPPAAAGVRERRAGTGGDTCDHESVTSAACCLLLAAGAWTAAHATSRPLVLRPQPPAASTARPRPTTNHGMPAAASASSPAPPSSRCCGALVDRHCN